VRGKLVESDDLLRKALSLDRDNADGLNLEMALFADVGRVKDALAIAGRVRALEPAVPAFSADIGRILWENGRNNEAIAVLKPVIEFGSVRAALAMIYASMGRYADGADLLEHDGSDLYREQSVQAARILRAAPAKAPAADTDPPLYTRPFPIDFVYLHTGYPERALGSFEEAVKSGTVQFGDLLGLVWHPSYAPARKTERFKQLMRDVGNVDYWRVKGWPDFCNPTTGDDFNCH
jgi:tetratricopeptide (TPR) repeat protein